MSSSLRPLVLSPALPTELLHYVVHCHVYPTTLIICTSKADFLDGLIDHVHHAHPSASGTPESGAGEPDAGLRRHPLRDPPSLHQLAVSRHIRTVYVPTVTHLHAYLSIFSPEQSKVAAPPDSFSSTAQEPPHLILYGAVELHRHTSEWSAQGLNHTAAAVADTGHRLGWRVALVEPRGHEPERAFEGLLTERLPIVGGGTRRRGFDSDEGGWSGRTVEVGRILSRWFQFQRGPWDEAVARDPGA